MSLTTRGTSTSRSEGARLEYGVVRPRFPGRNEPGSRRTATATLRSELRESAAATRDWRGYRIGVDVGGTFTDCVLLRPNGEVIIEKTPTTPEDQSIGVLAGIARLAEAEKLTACGRCWRIASRSCTARRPPTTR